MVLIESHSEVLNKQGELVPYWTTVPLHRNIVVGTSEEKRWRMIVAYEHDKNASYNKIAKKANVSFDVVKRWLPVYQRTGCVFDKTRPGPKRAYPKSKTEQQYNIDKTRAFELLQPPNFKPHPVSKVGCDKLHRIHARERMVQVYETNKTATHNAIAKEAGVSSGVVQRWLPVYLKTGKLYHEREDGRPYHL